MSSISRRGGTKRIRVAERSSDPGGTASEVQVYSKDVSGTAELFAQSGGGTVNQLTPVSGVDTTAIHDNTASEISVITEKATPISADLLVIEDSADSNNKKRVQVGNLPGGSGTDNDAIHDNVSAEISVITAKATPTTADFLLIEDAAATNAKKRITIGDLPGGGSSLLSVADASGATYAVGSGDDVVRIDPSVTTTVTLPAVAGGNEGRLIHMKNVTDLITTVTFSPDGSDTIDGVSDLTLSTGRGSYTLVSDGTSDWMIV